MLVTLQGQSIADLLNHAKLDLDSAKIYSTSPGQLRYDETRTICILSFGYLNFKQQAMKLGVPHGQCVYVSNAEQLRSRNAANTLLVICPTARARRDYSDIIAEAQTSGLA